MITFLNKSRRYVEENHEIKGPKIAKLEVCQLFYTKLLLVLEKNKEKLA